MKGTVYIQTKDLRSYLEIINAFEDRGKLVDGIEITFGECLPNGASANSVTPIFNQAKRSEK